MLLQNARDGRGGWSQRLDLSVYLDKRRGPPRAQAIAAQLRRARTSPRCASSRAAEALAEFRDYSGFGAALDALSDNPLPNTLIVTPALAASTPEGTRALKHAHRRDGRMCRPVQLDTDWVSA